MLLVFLGFAGIIFFVFFLVTVHIRWLSRLPLGAQLAVMSITVGLSVPALPWISQHLRTLHFH